MHRVMRMRSVCSCSAQVHILGPDQPCQYWSRSGINHGQLRNANTPGPPGGFWCGRAGRRGQQFGVCGLSRHNTAAVAHGLPSEAA